MFMLLLAVAGNETTRNATAYGMWALHAAPRAVRVRCSDDLDTQLDAAVEEILRWASPVLHFRRTATADDRDPRPGDQGGRQGRDVAHLGQPRRGGVRRPVPLRHHARARTSTSRSAAAATTSASAPTSPAWSCKLIFEEIARRASPTCTSSAEPEVLRSNFIGGIKHMAVEYTPGAPARGDRPSRALAGHACVGSVRGSVRAMAADHDHEITIKGGSFDLSDLGPPACPGWPRSCRWSASGSGSATTRRKAHNRKLAAFQLKEAVNLMQKGSILRPKYAEDMDAFIAGDRRDARRRASRPRTGTRFETTFTTMVDEANAYHEKYDKGFLRWQLPATPPPDLDLTAT